MTHANVVLVLHTTFSLLIFKSQIALTYLEGLKVWAMNNGVLH